MSNNGNIMETEDYDGRVAHKDKKHFTLHVEYWWVVISKITQHLKAKQNAIFFQDFCR